MDEKMVYDGGPNAQASGFEMLTDREMQVFGFLFNGLGVNDIASQLGISNKTVSTHKVRLMEKLELSSMADLIRYGEQHQLKA
jgi:DNA-binding NarL/FixJ family response regulator